MIQEMQRLPTNSQEHIWRMPQEDDEYYYEVVVRGGRLYIPGCKDVNILTKDVSIQECKDPCRARADVVTLTLCRKEVMADDD